MKTLFLALAMVCSLVRLDAATLNLDGDLNYNITEPRCSFQLSGKLQNLGAPTGTLKLVLYASLKPFPSPGYIVGEHTLAALGSGYQFSSFTVKTPAKLPTASGTYYFTVTVAEYTSVGWRNVLAEEKGSRRIVAGDLVGQKKYKLSTEPVLPPIGKMKSGMFFKLAAKAAGDELNAFPSGFQDKITVDIKPGKKIESTLRKVVSKGDYTFAVKTAKYNKERVDTATLSADYGSYTAKYWFFYQTVSSGTYKCIETRSSGKETTWGTFKQF
ncbi:MAG: hypothetical protein EOP88_02085 [Verrucomicrobiaceae bacterium]|nr:MAG: hypothetical protein EOP88_02085 [Verrucomicrobiaceae bacterium]